MKILSFLRVAFFGCLFGFGLLSAVEEPPAAKRGADLISLSDHPGGCRSGTYFTPQEKTFHSHIENDGGNVNFGKTGLAIRGRSLLLALTMWSEREF